jgi:hypothetical protein
MKIKIKCDYCKEDFLKHQCYIKLNKHHFCSYKCKSLWQSKNMKGKNNTFYGKKHTKETIAIIIEKNKKRIHNKNCKCITCKAKRGELELRGKNNPNYGNHKFRGKKSHQYIDGRTGLHLLIRKILEYNEWRKKVYERDNYTCQICGVAGNGKNLEAHHKKEFNIILNEFLQLYSQFSPIDDKETLVRLAMTYAPFWDIDNGQTLCEDCHDKLQHNKSIYARTKK